MNKPTLEEQVNALTVEEQDKILKVGKIGLIVILAVGIPYVVLGCIMLFSMIRLRGSLSYEELRSYRIGSIVYMVVGAAIFLGGFAIIKHICPQYSDKKYRYIKKMRETGKQ